MRYLSQLAEAEIDALVAEGVNLTPLDIVRINALAQRIESPSTRMALSRGKPVFVGGVALWPMTLAGAEWFQTIGCQMAGERKQTFALAYAMAHGRDDLPGDKAEADHVVGRWGRSLRCRYAELIEAITQIHEQGDDLDTGEKGQGTGAGNISAMLSAMTGVSPEVWEYQCSISYVLGMLDIITAQNVAEGASTKHDPRIKAERALGLAISKIRKRHKQGDAK